MVVSWTFVVPPAATSLFDMADPDQQQSGGPDPKTVGSYSASLLFTNDGKGGFSVNPSQPSLLGVLGSLDVDGDGDLDIIDSCLRLYLNAGDGTFTIPNNAVTVWGGDLVNRPTTSGSTQEATPESYKIMDWQGAYALGDLDGDGDADILGPGFQLYRNAGGGSFTDAGSINPDSSDSAWAALQKVIVDMVIADFDGDGFADAAAGVVDATADPSTASFRIYMNDGSGALQPPTTVFSSWFWQEVGLYPPQWIKTIAAGDIDGDGDIDLVTTQEGTPVMYNNGAGGFTAPALPPSSSPPNGQVKCSDHLAISTAGSACWGVPLLADIDNDGDIDLMFAKSSAYSETFLNTKGTLEMVGLSSTRANEFYGVENSLASTISYLNAITAADIDNDGE